MTDRAPGYVPTLEAVQENLQRRIRTIVPAQVIAFYPGAATTAPSADVQPVPFHRDRAGGVVAATPVTRAPILYPGGGGWEITWPLAPGDDVVLLCADRAVDQWRKTGRPGDPQDGRRHAITDALVYPGGWPDTAAPTLSPTEFTIRSPTGVAITITAGGVVNLGAQVGAQAVARATDPLTAPVGLPTPGGGMAVWALAVEAALAVAGSPILPASAYSLVLGAVPGALGTITSGATKVKAT